MAEMIKRKIKTPCCGKFYWVKGVVESDGVLNELSGNMERSVTIRYNKGSEQAKKLIIAIDEMWEEFKSLNPKIKQEEPSSVPYKLVLDKEGNKTSEIEFKFKTNATFQDGKLNIVKIFNAKGQDVTEQFQDSDIKIGNESEGIVHGLFATYEYAKKYGITAYLKAIQLAKLVEYNDGIEPEDLSEYADKDTFTAVENNEEPIV